MARNPICTAGAVLLLSLILGVLVVRTVRSDDGAIIGGRVLGGGSAQRGVPRWFADGLTRLDLHVDPETTWPVVRSVGVVATVLSVVTDPELIIAVVPFVAVGTLAAVGWSVARRAGRDRRSVDAAVVAEALVAPLGAGASLVQAVEWIVERAGPADATVAELASVHRSIRQGIPVQEAFDRWAATSGGDGRLLADALAVAGASGGSQVGALLGVGDTLREREALAREVRALSSQASASALALVVTPPAFTGVVAVADGRVASFLFGTPVGWACFIVGAAVDAVGWWWMRRLTGAVS